MSDLPIFEAKNHFAKLVHEAESGDSFRLTRHGVPAAMLIGIDEYERLAGSEAGLMAKVAAWRQEWAGTDVDGLEGDPFEGLRFVDPGRPVEL